MSQSDQPESQPQPESGATPSSGAVPPPPPPSPVGSPAAVGVPASTSLPKERTGLGLAAALGVVVLGVVIAVGVWRLGFIAGIVSAVMAGGALLAYEKAAGAPPRRGLPGLVFLILVGVVASMLACVASDLWDVYGDNAADISVGRGSFITQNLFNGDVWSEEATNLGLFVVFAVLGGFGAFRRMFSGLGR